MVKVKKAKQAQLVTVPSSIDMCVKRVLATHTFCEEEVMHDKSSQDALIDHAKVEVHPKSEGRQIMMILVPQVVK